jgi:hypothetical protein
MSSDEREKRHRHNYAHVTTHTAQDWAETFVCELNETVAEAQLRTRQVPPDLPSQAAIQQYLHSKNRLLILVLPYFFFATFCWLGCSDAKIACLFLSFFDVNIYSCLIAISLHSCFDLCSYAHIAFTLK